MTENLSWELYRTFLAVLTEGSLSGAARALGITQPTAGRHVAALEAAFGQALFTRSQSGLLPTEAALELRGYAVALRSTAAALERAAASHGPGVRASCACPPATSSAWRCCRRSSANCGARILSSLSNW